MLRKARPTVDVLGVHAGRVCDSTESTTIHGVENGEEKDNRWTTPCRRWLKGKQGQLEKKRKKASRLGDPSSVVHLNEVDVASGGWDQ